MLFRKSKCTLLHSSHLLAISGNKAKSCSVHAVEQNTVMMTSEHGTC